MGARFDFSRTLPVAPAPVPSYEQYTRIVGFDAATCHYVCDGVADEVEINQAMVAVNAAGGGTVALQAGTYNIAAQIVFAGSNIRLSGCNIGGTIISASAALTHMITLTGRNLCMINDVQLLSNGNATDGIRITGGEVCQGLWIVNVAFQTFDSGIGFNVVAGNGVNYLYILNCLGTENDYTFYVRGMNITISNCVFVLDTVCSIYLAGTSNVSVGNCVFDRCQGDGIYSFNGSYVTISNNSFNLPVGDALEVDTSSLNSITSNVFYMQGGMGTDAIVVTSSYYVTVTGNVMYFEGN